MPYIYIEPKNIHSVRNVMRIVCGLRKMSSVRKGTIINTEVNGIDEWSIIVAVDEEDVKSDVECWLNSNQDLICWYTETDNFWYRK